MEIARSYGPIARLWFGPVLVVVLTDPDCIETVVKHDKSCTRGYLVRKTTEKAFPHGLFYTEEDEWRRHRKVVSAALHINILETFVENFAKNSDIFANKLKALADGITAHDIVPYFMRCSLDIIVQTSYRSDINAQNGYDESTLHNITTIVDTIAVRFLKPWLLIEWIFKASDQGKKYYKAFKCEQDKIMNEIKRKKSMRETAEKTGQNKGKTSLIDFLIQFADMSKEEIVGDIASVIGAGSETTPNACGYVLALPADNQNIQERIMQEQQDIFGDGILRPVRSDDLPRMVYLEQVGNCLLRSSLFSRIVGIFVHDIK
jgi:cytochrome P450